MKKIYCDICGQEIKDHKKVVDFGSTDLFYDLDEHRIDDVCRECYSTIDYCINMMKRVDWRPDFHEKLNSESIWDSDRAGYTLSELEDKTGFKLF